MATEEFRCFTHVLRGGGEDGGGEDGGDGGGGEGREGVGTSSMPKSYCFMSPQACKKY